MIYTVTLSPSLTRVVDVEEIIFDDVNEIISEKNSPGGKGIDVTRVIRELGGQSIALGFLGGYTGHEVEGRLVAEGIVCDFTKISGETQSRTLIYQRRKNLQTLLSTRPPEVTPFEVAALYTKVRAVADGSYVVLGGAVPPGVGDNFFAQLITALKDKGVKVILDADGEALASGVRSGPFLIKPNIHEFGRLVGKSISDLDQVFEEAEPFLDRVDYIVVSAGARGVAGISRQGGYQVVPPKVKVRSSVGAGDSLVAGLAFVLNAGGTFEESLTTGVACGTATTLRPGNDLCTGEDADNIKKNVTIKKF